MRTLEQALQDHELIVLRVLGEWWELDLTGADKAACVAALAEKLSQVDMEQELLYLPPEEAAALQALVAANGRMPVAAFSRQHGEVRMMGPGRLEREEPWLEPSGPAEALWYRGFLYRGFDETAEGVIEFYYLPQELLAQFPRQETEQVVKETAVSPLTAVPPPADRKTAVTAAVDDLTTLLAEAQINGLQASAGRWSQLLLHANPDRRSLLVLLGQEIGLLRQSDGSLRPTRKAVEWLQQTREAQLRSLADAWSSSAWNDLRHTPELVCEGEGWENDPILARTALLDALPRTTEWYRLDDLVATIKETTPDFQRPDGNYDTWYIREEGEANYITGFAGWDKVEGRLLRFLLKGPLYWLGMAELGAASYRLTERALEWLADKPTPADEVRVPLVVQPDATLLVPFNAGRYERFQAARISEAAPVTPGQPFGYRLTPMSLAQAREQGIAPDRIAQFLEKASDRPLPASVKRALTRWGERGVEGKLETAVILRVRDADILETLRQNPKTRDYIGESLSSLAATVRADDWPRLRSAAAQLGLLLDAEVGE